MHYITGILVAAACVCSAVALPPCACTRNFKPVCGSDGNTYRNECQLNCEKNTRNQDLTVASPGICESNIPKDNCICTHDFRPVCGSDGTTYPNRCSLGCARSGVPSLEMKHEGRCKRETVQVAQLEPCVCTREMKPVCGSDGATYNNPCLLMCATQVNHALRVEHGGPCEERVHVVEQPQEAGPACACARNLQPVCAADGNTYSNLCIMRCKGGKDLTVQHEGPCES